MGASLVAVDYESAKLRLLMHGTGTTDADGNPLAADDGFLQMLRPYDGLKEDNFHSVLLALFVVGDRIHRQQRVDRDLVNTLWLICHRARAWGLHPKGMLQRNNVISKPDSDRLERWIDILDCSVQGVLNGNPPYVRVNRYCEYIVMHGAGKNVDLFIPYMIQHLQDTNEDPTAIANALAVIGRPAVAALPALRAVANHVYPDWCHDEAHAAIAAAIMEIEAST